MPKPQAYHYRFYECEHGGDLDYYAHEVAKSGAVIERCWLGSPCCETGYVQFHLRPGMTYEEFRERFEETDAHWFVGGGGPID